MTTLSKLATQPSLTLKRRFGAPARAVYDAWVEPERMFMWFGPAGAKVFAAEVEAKAGGSFHVGFRSPDGEEHNVSGIYQVVEPAEKLVFTWAWRTTPERQSLVTVLFAADGDGCLMTLIHEQFYDKAARDGHRTGWLGALDSLERYLAGQLQD